MSGRPQKPCVGFLCEAPRKTPTGMLEAEHLGMEFYLDDVDTGIRWWARLASIREDVVVFEFLRREEELVRAPRRG